MPILAAPSLPSTPPPAAVVGLSMVWHGFDGSEWSIGDDPTSGVRLGRGVRGLTMPEIQWYTDEAAGVDGAAERGYRTPPRPVFWPVQVFQSAKSQEWLDYDRAFWDTLLPGRTGVWEVVQPNGVSRRLTLRLGDDGAMAFDTDPALTGWARYGVSLTANQPYWEGDVKSRLFQADDPSDFFATGRVIASSFTLASATIDNPGDVPAYPVWTIVGPSTSVTLTIDGHAVEIPFTTTTGQTVVIDTAPTAQTAFLDGVDRTGDLGEADFAAVPAGRSVPLGIDMTGTGSVAVALLPRYYRAW